MLLASLSELLDDQAAFIGELNALGLPGVRVEVAKTLKQGVFGSRVTVSVRGLGEEAGGGYGAAPEHAGSGRDGFHGRREAEHEHGHGTLAWYGYNKRLPVSRRSKPRGPRCTGDSGSRGKAHGRPVELVPFPRFGALDAVCD
jgi:uncharacterized protein (DUF111 family)